MVNGGLYERSEYVELIVFDSSNVYKGTVSFHKVVLTMVAERAIIYTTVQDSDSENSVNRTVCELPQCAWCENIYSVHVVR